MPLEPTSAQGSATRIDGLPADKNEARCWLKLARSTLSSAERHQIDSVIEQRLTSSELWRNSNVLCIYHSMGSEVNTHALIAHALEQGKLVLLPRVVPGSKRLAWYVHKAGFELERHSFGVLEPLALPEHQVEPCSPDSVVGALQTLAPAAVKPRLLVVVPGLCFDAKGYRLGYGGGYYDHFLSELRASYGAPVAKPTALLGSSCTKLAATYLTLGLCREQFLAPSLRAKGLVEPWDQPVAAVLTQTSIVFGDCFV